MDKKEKVTVSLTGETLALEAQSRASFGFSTCSDFIEAALREYIARDGINHFADEIVGIYSKLERRELKEMEDRLAMLSYKIAVALAQINLTQAELSDYSYEDAQALRGDAVQMVNLSKGFITLPMAVKKREERYR